MACVGKLEHFRDCKFTWEDEPSKDKAAPSGSNLNITCALLKMPKSFKLLERIFSLINCVCWRVHNSAREMEGGLAKWRWCIHRRGQQSTDWWEEEALPTKSWWVNCHPCSCLFFQTDTWFFREHITLWATEAGRLRTKLKGYHGWPASYTSEPFILPK